VDDTAVAALELGQIGSNHVMPLLFQEQRSGENRDDDPRKFIAVDEVFHDAPIWLLLI
jgi:hypothetical protein